MKFLENRIIKRRERARKLMESDGWNDSGQVMEMISGSLMPGAKNPPVHVWFGSYHKTIRE